MNSSNLHNLEKIGQLKKESFDINEFTGLLQAGETRLYDAKKPDLAIESRFDLAYNAAHSLSLAALRFHHFRPSNKQGHRVIVFSSITLTTGLDSTASKILTNCHNKRNLAEYEGFIEIDHQLLLDLLSVTEALLKKVKSFDTGAS